MRVGFTGTRFGMTAAQTITLSEMMELFRGMEEFHHGDCVGADAEAHYMVEYIADKMVIHPPKDEKLRAFCDKRSDVISIQVMEPLTHFARNRNIVNMTDFLIATPYNEYEEAQGGTWMTVNYARKQKKDLAIIWPSGKIALEWHR